MRAVTLSGRIQRHLRSRMAVAKVRGRPILPAAFGALQRGEKAFVGRDGWNRRRCQTERLHGHFPGNFAGPTALGNQSRNTHHRDQESGPELSTHRVKLRDLSPLRKPPGLLHRD